MRRLAATALALCGCNQIYGLDPTQVRDGAPDRTSTVRLSMLVGQSTDTAAQQDPLQIAMVTPAPEIKIGLVGDPLARADYVAEGVSGVVRYPSTFVGERWRLEYTPALDVPHEIQWSPLDGAGHLIVPLIGRTGRAAPPANTGYAISMKMPNNMFYEFGPETVIYTTGYWSASPSPIATLSPVIDFSTAPTLSGPRGTPSNAAGDVVVAIDYVSGCGSGRVVKAAGTARVVDVVNGAMTPIQLTINLGSDTINVVAAGETLPDAQTRLDTALGTRSDDNAGSRVIYGRIAHTSMPLFTSTIAGVPAPAMIPLAECPFFTTQITTNDAGGGLSFTKAVFAFVANDRVTASGARLRSSIAGIGFFENGNYRVFTHVPLVKTIKLGAVDLESADLIAISNVPADLTFTLEADMPFRADYYEVTLYRIAGTALEPIRIYVGTDLTPTVRFDPSIMTAGDEYVFAIRTYRGRSGAKSGDFSMPENPQAAATIFTRTFKR